MKKIIILLAALLLVPVGLSGQFLDPDRCWTCQDKAQHAVSGAALDLFVRGPWIAKPWRNEAWKRVLWVVVIGAAYEGVQYDEARRAGKLGQPGYGFSLLDLAADVGGAILIEIIIP